MADKEAVYCTLVLNDEYLPGAAVLAHSLRDCGTTKKLACLVLAESLRASTIEELQSLYNYVIPIERIGNSHPSNLYLMNRPDLLYTFTKIILWRQTQFRKIVYIDADVVALRAPEELFDITETFAAAPDVGWPDAFNTGVMVLTPDMGEYYALRGLANAGDSFDGADQGLLNQYYEYRPWKRLSFKYNSTPSANYQYEPAYRYWKNSISMVHFIGKEKPWQRGRELQGAPGAFQEMLSRWWAVYDRHFQVSTTQYIQGQRHPVTDYVRDHKPAAQTYYATGYPADSTYDQQSHHHADEHHPTGTATPLMTEPGELAENIDQGYVQPAPTSEQRQFSAPYMEWDATRGAPPVESAPEAANFPHQTYQFSSDRNQFRPPQAYPEPPKDMYYQVPPPSQKQAEEKLKSIFPWEERRTKPTRIFIDDEPIQRSLEESESAYPDELEVTSDSRLESLTPTIKINDVDPWNAFAQNRNAWDDVNGINNYVRALTSFQKNRGNVQVVQQNAPSTGYAAPENVLSPTGEKDPEDLVQQVEDARERRESLILTDFPSAIERPSLPVTPAPQRRSFWGDERDSTSDLPPAYGVPDQADWDPNAQLEQLRRSSLMGPGDLKLPDKKLTDRKMPPTAASIPEHESAYHTSLSSGVQEENTVATTENGNSTLLSRGSSPHGLDGAQDTSSFTKSSATSSTRSATTTTSSLTSTTHTSGNGFSVVTASSSAAMPGNFPEEQSGSTFFTAPDFGKPVVVDEVQAKKDFQQEEALSPTQEQKTF